LFVPEFYQEEPTGSPLAVYKAFFHIDDTVAFEKGVQLIAYAFFTERADKKTSVLG
jgi:hypothetical protein